MFGAFEQALQTWDSFLKCVDCVGVQGKQNDTAVETFAKCKDKSEEFQDPLDRPRSSS